jgi:putative cardiolipin synthase
VTRALVLCAVALASGGRASADAYPWLPIGDDDVRVIESPRVEIDLRLELVRRATRSIDIVTYDQRADPEVALPLGSALREAAERGVRVRFLVSWNSQVMFDYYNKFGRLLIDPPTRVPIQYMIVGGTRGEDEGYGLLDGIHEKFLIVDDQVAMTTGRGIGAQYLYWLDTSFALRGPLVRHVAHCFEAIWRASLQHFSPYRGWLAGPRRSAAPRHATTLAPDPQTRRSVDELLAWWRAPDRGPPSARARLLHHDFLRQIAELSPTPSDENLLARLRWLHDPVVDALVARLRTAQRVRIATVSAILHPAVREAMLAALKRGAKITLLVNRAAPRLDRSRAPIEAGGTVWAMQAPDLDELIAAGADVQAFQIRDGQPWLFSHRKLAVLDDAVIIGSHNFNIPSSAFFDEASIELEHPRLAAALARIFDEDLARNGERLDPQLVHAEHVRVGARLLRWLSFPYLGYM